MTKLCTLVALLVAILNAGPIESLEPGKWLELTNTHLQDSPERATQSEFPWLTSGFGAIMNVWCGGAFDTQRDRMLIGPGGGHASYNGNEVYGFDMNDLAWHRLSDPNPTLPGQTECTDDSVPFAMHTYDGGDYLPPPIDRYMLEGGWCTEGTYAFDFNVRRWEAFTKSGLPRTGDEAAVDPLTGLYYFISGMTGTLAAFDYKTKTWANVGGNGSTYYATMTFDTKRRLLVSVGGGNLRTWDVKTTPVTFTARASTGDTTMVRANNPGCEYDPVIDRVVCWWGGADVYLLNTEDWSWEKRTPASGNTAVPAQPLSNGTYGRFRYVPSKNVYVLVNDVAQNVFVYRLSAGTPVIPVSLEASLVSDTLENGLTYKVTGWAVHSNSSRVDVSDSLFFINLTPAVVATGNGTLTALTVGNGRVVAGYTDRKLGRAVYDTLVFTVKALSGSLVLDSLKLSRTLGGCLVGEALQIHATGYYTRGSDHLTQNINASVTWASSNTAVADVVAGLVSGITKGGLVKISATLDGKSDTLIMTVYDVAPVTRINFQGRSEPFRAGWLVDNGALYDETRGYGWVSNSGFWARDDRMGDNFLLKSFIGVPAERDWKITVPDGRYLVKMALGDNQWGGSFTYLRYGTDTLITFVSGANTIKICTLDVTGGSGLVLTVNAAFNYVVVMPENGMDMARFADDGVNPTTSGEFAMNGNFGPALNITPNPFNPVTAIRVMGMVSAQQVVARVFSASGKQVARLSMMSGGNGQWKTEWRAHGQSSGLYLVRVTAGKRVLTSRVVLAR